MNILVTAGGTSEKIDDVRHITNLSTGALGKAIAEVFATDLTTTVTYLHGKQALTPNLANITLVPINSVADLDQKLSQLLNTQKFDAVIHSMAVSDYQLNAVFDQTKLSAEIAQELQQEGTLDLTNQAELTQLINRVLTTITTQAKPTEKKISSKSENLMISLGASVKVIAKIKQLQPGTLLVGFKLLVDVSKEELQTVAYNTLQKNQADFILANDLNEVSTVQHHGLLIDRNNQTQLFTTKSDIAKGIKTAVMTQLKGK